MPIDPQPSNDRNRPSRPAPRNYFSRGEQYRLLVLVFSLMLVLLLMAEAAKPKNWQWMWHLGSGEQADADTIRAIPWNETHSGSEPDQHEDVDTRLRQPADQPLPPGVFMAVADKSTTGKAVRSDAADGSTDSLFPGVTDSQLQTIRDDTVFRRAEMDAWFSWFDLLGAADEPVDSPQVTFLQLFRQPDEYRGRLIRVSGVVRRAHRVAAHANGQGYSHFYRCWLFPHSGGTNPIVVYALNLPDGFPVGMQLHEDVAFTGLFFKRWAYQATGGIMTAPLVLAANGDWKPAAPPPPIRLPSLAGIGAALVSAIGIGAGIAWLVYWRSNSDGVRGPDRRGRNLPDKAPVIHADSSSEK